MKIVIAFDSSPRAQAVLEAGRVMAHRMDAKVVLVSAIEDWAYQITPPDLLMFQDPRLRLAMEADVRGALDRAAADLPVVDKICEYGSPWRIVCETASKHSARLIVAGAHGYRTLERMLGTTASKIANRAQTSVLIARAPVGFDRIVVGHDGTERAASVVGTARRLGGQLTLVRAIAMAGPRPPSLGTGGTMTLEETLLLAARNGMRALAPEAEIEARIGPAWDVVNDVAKDRNATLIAIGSHGYHGWDRMLGTNAGRLVDRAERSVLIVRGDGLP